MKCGTANPAEMNNGISIAEGVRQRNIQRHHGEKSYRRDDAKGRRRKDEVANAETTIERRLTVKKHIGLLAKKDGKIGGEHTEKQ